MKHTNILSSSVVLSLFAISGSALLLGGCNPAVDLGSDVTGTDVSGANSNGNGNGNGNGSDYDVPNEVAPDGAVDCHVGLEDSGGGLSKPEIFNNGLSVSASFDGDGDTRATASHVKGKWYFEVHFDQMPGEPFWAQNIGAGVFAVTRDVLEPSHMGATYNVTGNIMSSQDDIGASNGDGYGEGDMIGVAMDLDAGRMYFRKNGVWQNGDPETGTNGAPVLALPGTGSYYPFLTVGPGDQMTANFGEHNFYSAPPAGYAAFADGLVADADGNCIDPGPDGVPADPAPLTASCADLTSYDSGEAGAAELNIVSVDEAESGTINVHVDRTMPMVLVLASYSPVQWSVTLAPGAQVQKIILSSYEKSTIVAPALIPVEKHIFELNAGDWFDVGNAWPSSTGGSDTPKLVENAEAATGLPLTSFSGCYSGGSFTLHN